jgi:hypothetical protein
MNYNPEEEFAALEAEFGQQAPEPIQTGDEEFAALEAEFGQAEDPYGVDLGGVEDSLVQGAANTAGFFGGVGKQLIYDAPETVTSMFGENSVSRFFGRQADEFDKAAASFGMDKDYIDAGEAVGTGIATGGAVGALGIAANIPKAAMALKGIKVLEKAIPSLSKAPTLSPSLLKGGKFKRTIGSVLEEARKHPLKVAALEGAIAGVADTTSKGVEKVTGSATAGFITSLFAGGAASVKLYDKFADGINLIKAAHVEEQLADNIRQKYTVEQIQEFGGNIDFLTKENMTARLDIAMQDGSFTKLIDDLKVTDPSLEPVIHQGIARADAAFKATVDKVTAGKSTSEDVVVMLEDIKGGLFNDIDNSLAQLNQTLSPQTAKVASEQLFKTFDGYFARGKESIDEAYNLVDMTSKVSGTAPRKILLDAAKKAEINLSASSDIVPRPVKWGAAKLRKELKDGMVLGGLKDVRSRINDKAMSATAAGRNEEAGSLGQLAKAVTQVLENHTGSAEFNKANTLYKSVATLKRDTDLYGFFATNKLGNKRLAPEQLSERFIFGTTALENNRQALAMARSPEGRRFGLTVENLTRDVENALTATLKSNAGGKPVTGDMLEKFITTNKDVIDLYGLGGSFANRTTVANRVKALQMDVVDLDKMTLNRYGLSGNNSVMLTNLKNGKLAKEIAKLPIEDRPALRKAAVNSMMYNNAGALYDNKTILDNISTYGSKAGMTSAHKQNISKLLNLKDDPNSAAVRVADFNKYFKHLDYASGVQSAVLERITRLGMKVARVLKLTGDVISNKKAQQQMRATLLTEDGAKRVLALAEHAPDSRNMIKWILGRGEAVSVAYNED